MFCFDGTRSTHNLILWVTHCVHMLWTKSLWSQAFADPFAVDCSAPRLSLHAMTFRSASRSLNVSKPM